MGRTRQYNIVIVVICCCFATSVAGQSITGDAPFNSMSVGAFDVVNEGNFNVHLSFPVLAKAGIGLPFNYALSYDSAVWFVGTNSSGAKSWMPLPSFGWRSPSEGVIGYLSYHLIITGNNCANKYATYHDTHGTAHAFSFYVTSGNCGATGSATVGAEDGSGYVLTDNYQAATFSLTDVAGNKIVAPFFNELFNPFSTNGAGSITDPNNNKISTDGSHFTDTLGTSVLTVSGTNPVVYAYTGGNGPASVKVHYSTFTVATTFGCAGIAEFPATAENLVSSIDVPTGTYTFQYDSAGRISRMNLPTGGNIQYTYSATVNCTDGTANSLVRKVSDGITTSTWTYTRTGTPASSTTTIKDPATSVTTVQFAFYSEILRKIYQGAATGTPLEQVTHCYNSSNPGVPCTTPTGPPASGTSGLTPHALTVLRVFNGGSSDQTVTYFALSAPNVTLPARLDLPTEIDSYDFGGSTPIRKKILTYGTWNSSACVAIGSNIFDHPCTEQVTNAGGTLYSSTTNTYDSHGNVTQVLNWTGTGAQLNTSFSYYANGALHTVTDPNRNLTTTYSNMMCGASPFAFPQTVTISGTGVSQTTSLTWDCVGGVVTRNVDANNHATTYARSDPYWRVTSVTAPYQNGTFTTTTTNYISPTQTETTLNVTSGNAVVDTTQFLDGLGRRLRTQKQDGASYDTVSYKYDANGRLSQITLPCSAALGSDCTFSTNTSSTQTYDAISRPLQVTNPNGGFVQNVYSKNDVLQKIGPTTTLPATEPLKQKQLEYDALGRLTSVCEVTGNLPGAGACVQVSSQPTGYWTRYSYDPVSRLLGVSQNAQGTAQTRTYAYDGLGRMTFEQNPENGATHYYYDNYFPAGTCWGGAGSGGDLMTVVDGAGSTTCFLHDGLHRVTDAAGWRNSTWSGPCRRFRYDASSNGLPGITAPGTVSNASGRLIEAETDPCVPWPPLTSTDEWFSYNDRGDLTDLYQSTPGSGGYYHSSAQYFENGALSTLIPGITGNGLTLPWLYTLDSAGRIFSVGNPSGAVLQSTTYNPDSSVANLAHINGDNEVYSYTAGRMTQYQFNIGATPKSLVGTLTWNPNGTLQMLGLNDGFNTNNSQICTYSHDDVVRLASVNCTRSGTNVWNQTFTYDAFGNITKSVPTGGTGIAFAPGYDPTTNHYLGVTYSGSGNPQNDGAHSYTWDANWGVPATIDSTTLLYDALGRMVEQQNGTTSTQVMYGPTGKIAVMNGQTEIQSIEPLPGGGVFIHRPSLTNYWRHPDILGSSRLSTTLPGRTKFYDVAYAPFGEDYNGTGTKDLSFTGQAQDTITTVGGLYDFTYREYAPRQARWVWPDPAGLSAANPNTPQSWNRYAYVLNSPLSYKDPTGFDCAYLNDAGDGLESVDQFSEPGECGSNGGYWVDGGLTNYQINTQTGFVQLWGTNTGTDQSGNQSYTYAQYQDTTLNVGWFLNTFANPFGHIGIGIGNNSFVGLNPANDFEFVGSLWGHSIGCGFTPGCNAASVWSNTVVPGVILPESSVKMPFQEVSIPITGMQANMIQGALDASTLNPPNYSVFGRQPACDCGTWAQQIMFAGGLQSGSAAPIPATLIEQLNQIYSHP